MKWIRVPPDISLIDEFTEELAKDSAGKAIPAKSFVEFCMESPLRDHGVFGSTIEALESRNAIRDALLKVAAPDLGEGKTRKAMPGDVVSIHANDYDLLLNAVKRPSSPYLPQYMGQLLAFVRAIRDAKDKPEDL